MITSKFGYGCKYEVLLFVSGKNIYAQLIDLMNKKTLFSVSTLSKDNKNHRNIVCGKNLGKMLAEKCNAAKISNISFNRGEKIFHGIVKALADSFYSNLK